jgi:NAD(P)-dependent dehydrogenase (short-subunit alcohol dehydrogenase family)
MSTKLCTLVTGASSGIGREIAVRISSYNSLILCGRNLERLEETKQACSQPQTHSLWQADLNDIGQVGLTLAKLMSDNNINVENFIHCAAVNKIMPMRAVDHKIASDIMNTNYLSSAVIISLLLKKAVNKQQLKTITFISSIASKRGAKGLSIYSASKGALDAMMRSLAVELAPNIRVNSILPGAVKTKMNEYMSLTPEDEENFNHNYPLGAGEPNDIVNAVEFLISAKARWITGQQIVVDGGRSINITM